MIDENLAPIVGFLLGGVGGGVLVYVPLIDTAVIKSCHISFYHSVPCPYRTMFSANFMPKTGKLVPHGAKLYLCFSLDFFH